MRHKLFIMFIALLILFFFKNAFSIGFFKDDLFFLNISKANSLADFLNFFNPFLAQHGGFRPISTQLFHFTINTFNLNITIIHSFIFGVYLVGLIYLYYSLKKITHQPLFAQITTLLYSISFIHVFQLYQTSTFQEISLFTFLSLSFYFLIIKRIWLSFGFFILALLSKEYAIFYPVLLWALYLIKNRLKIKLDLEIPLIYLIFITLVAGIFAGLTKYELSRFAENKLYTIHLSPRLMANNLMWLGLWTIGFPIYLPDYMVSIFQPPLSDFYKTLFVFNNRLYLFLMLAYLFILITSTIYLLLSTKHRRHLLYLGGFSLIFFTLFNMPTLPTIHKTMIRLTIPLIFVCLFQATIISKLFNQSRGGKIVAGFLIGLYLVWNYYGTIVHESASTIKLESAIYFKSKSYFDKNRNKALTKKYIYIKDFKKGTNPWGGSRKLNDTYWGQNFVKYIFPEKNITMLYQFETPKIPKNAFVVRPIKLLPY